MARSSAVAWLRERCAALREQLPASGTTTPEEIAAVWPGGTANPKRNLEAWMRCYGDLRGFCARIGLKLEQRTASAAERQEATLAALADTPETVPLMAVEGKERKRLTVYPKSWVALEEVSKRNLTIAWLIDQGALIEQHGHPNDLEVLLRIRDAESYLQRVLAWIATTPGVGLPFDESETDPDPPAEFADLHPVDFYAIAAAFQRVNVKRLLVLESTRKNEMRPDWSVFLTAYAEQTNRATPEVMRDLSLASVIAHAAERARGHEQAMVAAERDRKLREQMPSNRRVA